MPPRGKTSKSNSRSRSRSGSRTASPRASTTRASKAIESPQDLSMPAPDPAAVQRLIDEALARAQAGHKGDGRKSVYRTHPRQNVFSAIWNSLFGRSNVVFTPTTSSVFRDLVGIFLVTCFVVYFTVAGYLFYREVTSHVSK